MKKENSGSEFAGKSEKEMQNELVERSPMLLTEPTEIFLKSEMIGDKKFVGEVISVEKRVFDDKEKYVLKLRKEGEADTYLLVLNRTNALFLKKHGIIYDIDLLGKKITIEAKDVMFQGNLTKGLRIVEVE